MSVQNKPYILVTEFYGIDGQCVTLANALKGRLAMYYNGQPYWEKYLKLFLISTVKGISMVI